MDKICENLCEAVRIIIEGDKQNNPPQYDVTKDCTIVDVKNKHKGRYGVSDGSSTFEACAAAGASYLLGDQVLVTIPQGNYSNQKTILNKIITESDDAIGYVSPLDNFIKGSGNLIAAREKRGIKANGDILMEPIWELQETDGLYFGFTRLALVADFMTFFTSQNIIKGEYGLKLIIHGNKSNPDASAPVTEFTFSASEMLGNIYNFNSFFKQEAVFTIPSNINSISKMELYLYQDGLFIDGNGQPFTPPKERDMYNIFVQNIEVYLGYQGDYSSQEIVQVACNDLTYNEKSLNRYLILRWLHKIDEGVFEPISIVNYDADQHEVRWYKYVSGCSEEEIDEYGGKNWQWINKNGVSFPSTDYPFTLSVTLNDQQTTEKFKVVTIYKDHPLINDPTYIETKYYDSNILEFTNTEQSTDGGTSSPEQNPEIWSLHFHDNSFGNYFLYDQNGQLIDGSNQSSKKRVAELYYKGEELSNYSGYSHIKYIKWEVPTKFEDSMIIYVDDQDVKIENPKENILGDDYTLGRIINYSNVGTFEYSAKIQVPKNEKTNEREFDKIKIFLYTTTDDNWEKLGYSPYTYTKVINSDEVSINTQFIINRDYNKLKITYKYYKNDEEVEISTDPTSGHKLELFSIFHTGTSVPTVDEEGNKHINAKFEYTIASNWNQSRNNNIIKCTIYAEGWNEPIVITENLRFGQKGTSGTANTFILEMLDGKNALLAEKDATLRVEALLINTNGKLISLEEAAKNGKIEWTIINHNEAHMSAPVIVQSGTDKTPIVEITCNQNGIPDNNYAILQAKYQYPVKDEASETTPYLYAFLPIPMKTKNCLAMSGPDRIIYNHMGQPRCGDNSYIAFHNNGDERYYWKISEPETQLNPNPVTLKDSGTIQTANQVDDPEYEGTLKCGLTLNPSPLYATRNNDTSIIQDAVCVYCYGTRTSGSVGPVLWSQPILIMQSNYDFAMLNSWNGDLTIDEENGTILATMLGAGKKNSDNQFSGVLIGDIQGGTGLQDTITLTGVYGFQNGIITYGLQENGTAFFGAKSNGRIEINGQHGAIHSYGWTPEYNTNYTKWTLDKDKASSGSVFDLDDGQLQLYANDYNYLKYNNDNSGKLEMALSGANIILNDKTGNPGLSGYIDATAKGLVTEFRRTAAYYATCETQSSWSYNEKTKQWTQTSENAKKIIELKNFTTGFTSDNAEEENVINALTAADILKDGITIAITFTNAEIIKTIQNEQKATIDGREEVIGYIEERTGSELYLNIGEYSRRIYINNSRTKSDNSFGWIAGSTIYFTYIAGSPGHWEVSDSGSYSKITQTADMIKTEVSNVAGTLGSSITQTANSIRSEVRQKANYNCVCHTLGENNPKWIRISDYNKIPESIEKGFIINVTFNNGNTITNDLEFKLCDNDANSNGRNPIRVKGSPKWEAGETLPFVYNGSEFVMTSISNSAITQTAHSITSEVRRTAGYGCIATKPSSVNSSPTRRVWTLSQIETSTVDAATHELKTAYDDIYYDGVTLAVTFNSDQPTTDSTATEIWLKDSSNKQSKPVYIQNNEAITIKKDNITEQNKNKVVTWKANDTVFLTYSSILGGWRVVDSGAYSKITQTADAIRSEVTTTLGNYSTIEQTANAISSHVEDALGNYSTTTQTAEMISNEVNGKLDQTGTFGTCGWSITTSGFNIYKKVNDITTNLFNVDTSGNATFSGSLSAASGTFAGELSAVNGSFTTLTAGSFDIVVNNQTKTYKSTFAGDHIELCATWNDNSTPAKQVAGKIFIGSPNVISKYWEDISIIPSPILEFQSHKVLGHTSYGNVGTEDSPFDLMYARSFLNDSTREIKENILTYDNNQAYEELKCFPLYTYTYKTNNNKTKMLKLGSIIDYFPSEVMATKTESNKNYDRDNLTFWNIAATQATQSRVENLIARVEYLEQLVKKEEI